MNLKTESNQLDAIKTTMLHTGKAITFNAVVVISGFLVLLFSVFPPNRTLGALVSMNMFTSFLGTLTQMCIRDRHNNCAAVQYRYRNRN